MGSLFSKLKRWQLISKPKKQMKYCKLAAPSQQTIADMGSAVCNRGCSHSDRNDCWNLFDLPNELLVMILNRLSTMDIMTCKKVSPRSYRLINANWYRIPRPRMRIEADFKLIENSVVNDHKKSSERIAWTVIVVTVLQRYPERRKEIKMTYYENGYLRISEPTRFYRRRTSRKSELLMCQDLLKEKGFSGKIRRIRNSYSRAREYELCVEMVTWTVALKECLWVLTGSKYRLSIFALDCFERGALPEYPSIRLFHEIIEDFVRKEPVTIEVFDQRHHHSKWLPPIFRDSLQKITDQKLTFLYQHVNEEAERCCWIIEFKETGEPKWSQLNYRSLPKTMESPKQAHAYKTRIALPFADIHKLVEMSVSHVIEFEMIPCLESMIPQFIQTMIRQWTADERRIQKLTILLDHYFPSRMDYRLNIMEILSELSPLQLGPKEGCLERFWIRSRSCGRSGIAIQLVCVPDKMSWYGTRFAYVFEEQGALIFEVLEKLGKNH